MPEDVLVKCEHVSKKFCRGLKRSLWYGVQDICSELNPFKKQNTGSVNGQCSKLRPDEFWAVNDISFELKRGECLGLIGHNGAGKSTLLKMLNGLIKPDHGKITMKGRIGALIELNAGFNPILTGRENVYIYGTILGFTKKDIDNKYDTIVEFAEMEDFMEMPFRSYSSGMKVRLGFAVAAQMEPDVLIIDEVLAVGDIGFKHKCHNIIVELIQKCAVIIVSHSMTNISKVSNVINYLKNGKSKYYGKDLAKGINLYYHSFDNRKIVIAGDDKINLENITVKNKKAPEKKIRYYDDVAIKIDYSYLKKEIRADFIIVSIFNSNDDYVAESRIDISAEKNTNCSQIITIPDIPLAPGKYNITIIFTKKNKENKEKGEFIAQYRGITSFNVIGETLDTSANVLLNCTTQE